jgi:hydrogenase maturation factor
MCLSIPGKIKSVKKGVFEIDYGFEKRKVKKSLKKVKTGDYVLVQYQTIVKKIPQKQANEILHLINKKAKI